MIVSKTVSRWFTQEKRKLCVAEALDANGIGLARVRVSVDWTTSQDFNLYNGQQGFDEIARGAEEIVRTWAEHRT